MWKKKKQAKIRLTIEMDIALNEYPNLTAGEVAKSIILQDSDMIDGFEITTNHPDLDNNSDFVLSNGVIVRKELIAEVQSEENDYKHEVIESVNQEFKTYEAELLSRTPEEVYAHSYESMVKTEFREAICGEVTFDDNVYKALYQEKGRILEELHQDFIVSPEASVNSFAETGIFIEDYCNRYHGEIMCERSEDTGMGMS